MVISIDFKVKLDSLYAKRTVGLWSSSKFMQDGRFDNTTEVWTAPSELGEVAELPKDWRKQQNCLCVSTQMGLTMPLSVNERRRSEQSRSKL